MRGQRRRRDDKIVYGHDIARQSRDEPTQISIAPQHHVFRANAAVLGANVTRSAIGCVNPACPLVNSDTGLVCRTSQTYRVLEWMEVFTAVVEQTAVKPLSARSLCDPF